MHFIVYKTTNLINGKFYIGQHKTNNLEDGYLGSGKLLQRAIKKYGVENFKREILMYCDNQTDMSFYEKQLVELSQNSYNLCPGGRGGALRTGVKLTEETKQKISTATKSAMTDPELRNRLSIKARNKIVSAETRKKHSIARKGKTWISNPETKETRMIHNNQLFDFLNNNWVKGRLFNNPFVKSGTNFRNSR